MATLRLPHFIIAGAPRSGTTWVYMLADRHPGIAMAKPWRPEPKFFLVDELYERGISYYSSNWFEVLPPGRILGEKSANYLESPTVAARIKRDLPDIRFIFILRNPVDRAYSNYLWSCMNGLETETFERALALEDMRDQTVAPEWRFARPHAYFSRGLYADHLSNFFRRFRRDQILVLRTEDVEAIPHNVAAEFFRFVGVEPMSDLADGLTRINSARPDNGGPPLSPVLRAELVARYREPNRQLRELLRDSFVIWDDV
jgi:sulfotransferase family protein